MTEDSKYPTEGLKAYLDGDAPRPFYFYDGEATAPGANGRIIAWSGYRDKIGDALRAIVRLYGDWLDVQFRIIDDPHWEESSIRRFVSKKVPSAVVQKILSECADILIGDSGTEICIRASGRDSYLAFDDLGFLFVYAPTADVVAALESACYAFSEEPVKLFERGCWRLTVCDVEEKIERIVKPLQMEEY
jgi:hypothetical protein